jgi:predicted nucleotidyltransferase component of viral defense system
MADFHASLDNALSEQARRIKRAADAKAFEEFYTRVARALVQHHRTTGVEIRPGNWKIVVSHELYSALQVFARRLEHNSTALEVSVNGAFMAGIPVVPDDDLEGNDVRLRAEVQA